MSLVQIISPDRLDEIVDVLCDAFHDYPVMRYLVGAGHGDYDDRLQRLIGFFATAAAGWARRIWASRTGTR